MIIINDKQTVLTNTEYITHINIHTSGNSIIANLAEGNRREIHLGHYTSKKKCEIAFGRLMRAIEEEKKYHRMATDEEILINTQNNAGHRKIHTNGKTK